MSDEVGVAEVSHYVAKTPVRRCTRAIMRPYENAKDQRKRFPAPLLSLSRSRWRPRDKRIKSTLVCSPFPVRYPAGPGPRPVYIHICCRRLRPLHSFILISIYLLESRPTPAVPALHRAEGNRRDYRVDLSKTTATAAILPPATPRAVVAVACKARMHR